MKKAILAAGLLALSCNLAYAYDNYADGYMLKGKAPDVTFNAKNLYGYYDSNISEDNAYFTSAAHFITSLSAEEAKQYIGEAFSSAYFDEQYEKLALMQRSRISLQTVPISLIDLTKYADDNVLNSITVNNLRYNNLKESIDLSNSELRIDKIGKYKTITVTYFLKQADNPYIISTTFISDNDRLYILSSTYGELLLDKINKKTTETNRSAQELLSVNYVNKNELTKDLLDKAWSQHKEFLRSFKSVPVNNVAADQVSYKDKIVNKNIDLPDTWLYQCSNFKDTSIKGQVMVAMPVSMLYNLSQDEVIYNLACDLFDDLTFIDDENEVFTTEQARQIALKNQDNIIGIGNAVFKNIDDIFIVASFKSEYDDFKDFTDKPLETKLSFTGLLEEGFQYITAKENDYFKINDYIYDIDFDHSKGKVDIKADINYFKDNPVDTRIKFICDKKDKGSFVLLLHKQNSSDITELSKQINEWQF